MFRTVLVAVALAVTCVGCGGGGGGGGPTAPAAPPLAANIDCIRNDCLMTFPDQFCLGNCVYSIEYRNYGAGCGNTVRGVVRLRRRNNSTVERDEWELNPTGVVRPNEAFVVTDCCFSRSAIDAADHFTTEEFWTNVPCPGSQALASETEGRSGETRGDIDNLGSR